MKTKKCLRFMFSKVLSFKHTSGSILLGTLFIMSALNTYAQQGPANIGGVTSFYESLKPAKANERLSSPSKKPIKTGAGETIDVTIRHNKETSAGEVFIGHVESSKNSYAIFIYKNGTVEGSIVLTDQKKAWKYTSHNGNVLVTPEDINKEICVEFQKASAAATPKIAAAPPAGSYAYTLQSLPGATAVVLLDFDGYDATGSYWGDIIAAPADVTESDIVEAWQSVSEDYRPYQLNITTSEAVYQAAPDNRRMRCVITPTNTAAPQYGGVAKIGSFTLGTNLYPCWVFNGSTANGSGGLTAGESASHEIGHTLGLHHDGQDLPDGTHNEYFYGQGNWSPIMGFASAPVSQFSKGEYQYANNTEDDIAIISTSNGFSFRADDAGNTTATAGQLVYNASGAIDTTANVGIIETRTDVDYYKFTSTGGTAVINVVATVPFPDLDVELTLRNSSGAVISTVNPSSSLNATLSIVLSAGTYYISIDGVGQGDPFTNGYSDYSSVGQYRITGNIQLSNTPPTVSLVTPVNGAFIAAPATFELSASVNDLEGPIAKVEFYQNNVKIGEDDFYPGFGWRISNLPAGIYTFKAIAYDQGGMTAVSQSVTVTVDGQPPIVNITSPANNATFTAPASFSILTDANDGQGPIKKVEFYQNNVLIGEDDFYPGFGWNVSNLPAGTYVFTAKAFDQANQTTTSAPITVIVTAPCVLSEPTPLASNFILRNGWRDDLSGSNVSNESGALKIVQRAFGQNELWVLETGSTFTVTNGQVYNVKLDFKDFQTVGVAGIDIGFATGVQQNGSGPVLSGSTVTFPVGYSSSAFTTKSLNITSATSGSVFLAIHLRWNSQPSVQVTDYIKNVAVCIGAGTTSRTALDASDVDAVPSGIAIGPNPSENEFTINAKRDIASIHVIDLQGKKLFVTENISQSTQVAFGDDFSLGFYIVQVNYPDGTHEMFKILKTK